MTADAFIHLPELRARVTHPEKSLLRLTPKMFSMWEQRARAAGWPAGWRLSDEAIEASRLRCSAITLMAMTSGSTPTVR
ncbi:hypothetical protein [Bradyrhizobium retamae]|uniref:hypothetical protein n=1 Tax=Bradyrhizobium retamae TaxID=1300035 RepID=UPI000AE80E14|nr:hypothetical protein [Bradyrhizobium retamae]